jgi:hypothetical protein
MTVDLKSLPGLKAREIGKTITGVGVAAQGPIFYRVTLEQFAIDQRAVQRQHGLENLIGDAAIAAAMGPDEDVAKLMQKSVVFVAMQDFMNVPLCACLTWEGE